MGELGSWFARGGMTQKTDATPKIRPLVALWHFGKAAVGLVVAFYCFKYAYFLVTEQPADLGLDAASKKARSAAAALEKVRDRR